VSANITIEDVYNAVSFAPGASADGSSKTRKNLLVAADHAKTELKLALDLYKLESLPQLKFDLLIESDDHSSRHQGKGDSPRPYRVNQEWREWREPVTIEILEPSRLDFDKHMLVFGGDNRIRELKASNTGQSSITLNRRDFTVSQNFVVSFGTGANAESIEIAAGWSSTIYVIMQKNDPDTSHLMMINYLAGEEKRSEKILLFNRNNPETDRPRPGFSNIIAIDFGTRKTAVARYDVNHSPGTQLSNNVEMIRLEEDAYEAPSCMIIDEDMGYENIYVGKAAELQKGLDGFVGNMKMQLRKEKIEVAQRGKTIEKDTEDIITEYLKKIFLRIKESLRDEDSYADISGNKYIFTLPVLDDGRDSEKQKEVTLLCAQEAGFGDVRNIETISEPEAAMYYIINSIKDEPKRWEEMHCTLQDGDRICVFDYGGGTLDICYGTYMLQDGRPTVIDVDSIGRYKNAKVDLGGNRLDNGMAIGVLNKHADQFKIEKQVYTSDNEELVSANVTSPYARLSSFFDALKEAKEKLSKNWDTTGEEGVDIGGESDELDIYLTKEMFSTTVKRDLKYAINEMKLYKKNGGKDPNYIFMVGGTSLIRQIKERLIATFPRLADNIYNAYDYAGEGADYEAVRQAAIYPVVKGAAISYVTTITDLVSINLRIIPDKFSNAAWNPIDDDRNFVHYKKGEGFRGKMITCPAVYEGDWSIQGFADEGTPYHLGSFKVQRPESVSNPAFRVIAKIDRETRGLKVSYRFGATEIEAPDLDIFV